MRTRQLGETDLAITPVGIGTWAIGGGDWQFGWASQHDDASVSAIHRALDLGVNWIDTAAAYGFGHAEEIVARALRGLRERPYVFTKGSLVEGPDRTVSHSLQNESLRREVEMSLRRLELEALDLYQIHWPIPDDDLEEGWATLAALQKEGKIRHIGVSNFNVQQLERAQAVAPVATIQPPYSLVAREAADHLFPYAERHGIGVIVYSPLGSGRLSGRMTRESMEALPENDWRRNDHRRRFQGAQLDWAIEVSARLREIAASHAVPPGAIAIAWALRPAEVTGAIVGFRKPEHVDDLLPAAVQIELTSDEIAYIEEPTPTE